MIKIAAGIAFLTPSTKLSIASLNLTLFNNTIINTYLKQGIISQDDYNLVEKENKEAKQKIIDGDIKVPEK